MNRRIIDNLDGCIYECPLYPGVWSDWCIEECLFLISSTDKDILCGVSNI